jgi:hypothetical protein
VTVHCALTPDTAAAIRDRLFDDGIPVWVEIEIDPDMVHLWPGRVLSTGEEVTALSAFIAATDSRIAWHEVETA